jgi:ribonuclease T
MQIKDRIRSFLPVVIDIETGGFDEINNPILEICAIILKLENNIFSPKQTLHYHIKPFENSVINPEAIKFNGINLDSALREAISEKTALSAIFTEIKTEIKNQECTRAILVGHNAFFDLGFIKQAANRNQLKSPFHQFSTIDTLSLGALIYGETVLAKIMQQANITFDINDAHSALYDSEKTAELFCQIFNNFNYVPQKV